MNLSDSEQLELNALCNALIDGQLTDAERARLEQLLRDSEEARRFYVRALGLSASLMQYAGEMQTEPADAPLVTPHVVRPPNWIWTLGSLAAAAAIVLAFWMGWTQDRGASGTSRQDVAEVPPESEEGIGRLSGAKDCHWSGVAFRPGDDLRSGQQLKLDSGFAEITFDSGAQVTLEGPAVLDLHSAWEAVLQRGTLKANVPAEAVGFRITNPSVNVVDLGTEFSMVADDAGTTEVFVLKGAVETTALDAAGREARPVVLREKQARRFARAGGDEVHDREAKIEKLMRKIALERFTRPVNYVHWSFDELAGNEAEASVPGFEARLEGNDGDLAAAHMGGHVAQALNLDGRTIARASFPGLSQRSPRTVAFWVNIPEDASLPDAGAILAWPLTNFGRSVAIGWNRNPTEGVLGALRTDAGRSSVVGSAALRDGRWHHLAVVLSPRNKGEKPDKIDKDGPWLLRQYVDGRLEATSFKHGQKRARGSDATAALPLDETLWIGRAVDDSSGEHFRGMIDELFVADAELTPQEIRHLMQKNKPATQEILAVQ
jgi:ferric-dicitrate binding protein FerR (iron transport regulator)